MTKRTDADLKKSIHGQIFATARKAFQIGNRQAPVKKIDRKRKDKKTGKTVAYKQAIGSFKGVPSLADVKYPTGAFYGAGKPKSSFWKLAGDSAEFKSLKAKAKAAYPSVLKQEWNKSVQDFLEAFMDTRTREGGGERSVTTSSIEGFSF